MEQDSLPTEIILAHPRQSLGKVRLDWMPQAGDRVQLEDNTYLVLERHHHYQYKIGGYRLNKISLYVQTSANPDEQTLIDGHWILGDASCTYNARSELIRCAVNPDGPCEGCRHYEKNTSDRFPDKIEIVESRNN